MSERNFLKLVHGKNGNDFIRDEQGNSLMLFVWNTRTGEPAESNEFTRRVVALMNAFNAMPTEVIENAGHVPSNLELFLLDWDQWTDESYAEDVFPRWLLDMAGGLDYLEENGLTIKDNTYADEDEGEGEDEDP